VQLCRCGHCKLATSVIHDSLDRQPTNDPMPVQRQTIEIVINNCFVNNFKRRLEWSCRCAFRHWPKKTVANCHQTQNYENDREIVTRE